MKNFIVTHEMPYPIQPEHINAEADVHFWNAFGNMETEISAWWLVKFAQAQKGWMPFTETEVEQFYFTTRNLARKGSFRFNQLISGINSSKVNDSTWIVVRGGQYFFTHSFITRCFGSSPTIPASTPRDFQ